MNARVAMSAAALLGPCVLLAGCETPPPAVNQTEPANRTARPSTVADERVTADPALAAAVQLLSINDRVNTAGLREVQFNIQNVTDGVRRFRWQVEWVDADGFTVRSPLSDWRDETIAPGEFKTLQAVAPEQRAFDFRLKMIRGFTTTTPARTG
ncbi:MAG: YcfL family protein [Planctomycetota bacterium]